MCQLSPSNGHEWYFTRFGLFRGFISIRNKNRHILFLDDVSKTCPEWNVQQSGAAENPIANI